MHLTLALLVLTGAPPLDLHRQPGLDSGVSRAMFGLPRSLADLVRTLLSDISWRRRVAAAQQLGQSGDPRVIEALSIAATEDTNGQVRQSASEAIRFIRGNNRPPWPGPGPGPFPPPLPNDPYADMVNSWYERFLGRSADRDGMKTFVGMLRRGTSPEEAQSLILGSDEFWNRMGGTPAGFVRGLYGVILNRQPTFNEVAVWVRRYGVVQRNRSRLAHEFIQTAQQELLGRQQDNPIYPW